MPRVPNRRHGAVHARFVPLHAAPAPRADRVRPRGRAAAGRRRGGRTGRRPRSVRAPDRVRRPGSARREGGRRDAGPELERGRPPAGRDPGRDARRGGRDAAARDRARPHAADPGPARGADRSAGRTGRGPRPGGARDRLGGVRAGAGRGRGRPLEHGAGVGRGARRLAARARRVGPPPRAKDEVQQRTRPVEGDVGLGCGYAALCGTGLHADYSSSIAPAARRISSNSGRAPTTS